MNGMVLNDNVQEYIQALQEIQDKMKKDLPDVDWPRSQSLQIRIAIGYIGAAIYGLKLSKEEN